jgi:hypothetical protein
MVDATAPEETKHRTPTVPRHQLEDLLKEATVRAASAEAAVTLVAATAVAEAQRRELIKWCWHESLWQRRSATSPASHTVATIPTTKLKKYVARGPLRQETATATPPSPLDFATCFS